MNDTPQAEPLAFSLVMTCYNVAKFVRENIISCLQQDYPGQMQLILVNDASTDNTAAVIEETIAEYGQGKDVTILHHKVNRGVSAATDTGWAAAKHPWIIMVDGDDIQCADRCANTARLVAEHPELSMIIMTARMFSDENPDMGILPYSMDIDADAMLDLHELRTPVERAMNYLHRGYEPCLNGFGCCMAFRRTLYEKWGNMCKGPEDDGHFIQDAVWELRAFLRAPVCGSSMVACNYRIHENNIHSSKRESTYAGILAHERSKERYALCRKLDFEHMLDDVKRAREEGLTDWSEEHLEELESFLHRKLHGRQLRAKWWDASLYEKIRRILIHRGKADFIVRDWAIPRLLPLRVFAAWRWWRERAKRK